MSSDWDEIRRLAADLQKVQSTSTLQKLSETNIIEIINMLIEKRNLKVIATTDGKEYVTPEHLQREVQDELQVHGGRVNLVDVAKSLKVDLVHVNRAVDDIVAHTEGIHRLLGQLVSDKYIERTATEINERLALKGEISVGELTVQLDLPSDFLLHNVMEKHLGKLIRGKQDPHDARVFFTQNYITRCKSRIRGALLALTRPTPLTAILKQTHVQERMFHSLFNEISPPGTMTSKQAGAQYIPNIYTKSQVDAVNSFYSQNGYLEYETITRLGVADDVKRFIKRQFPNENMTFLKTCAIGSRLLEEVESSLAESISTSTYLDVSTILSSSLSQEDYDTLISNQLAQSKQKLVQFGTTIFTMQFIDNMLIPCYEKGKEAAKQSVDSGKYQQFVAEKLINTHRDDASDAKGIFVDKKEERRRKAVGGKGGGGTQGRETKTKSTKKHYRGGGNRDDSDSEDERVVNKTIDTTLELISQKEIAKIIAVPLAEEGLDDLANTIARFYHTNIAKTSFDVAKTLYEATLQNSLQSKRQTHGVLQEKLNSILVDIRLYEKGLKLLPIDVQPQLIKYLLKTLGTDVCNHIAAYVAQECNINISGTDGAPLTTDQRIKIAQECSQDYKPTLVQINKLVGGPSVEDFLVGAEAAMQACCMILKKIDKKKDRQLVLCHKHGLLEQLDSCNDHSLVLHLVVLVIFTVSTQNMLHASGRHVSSIMSFLQPSFSPEMKQTLSAYHDLVLKHLNAGADSEEGERALQLMDGLMESVKKIAIDFKKPGVTTPA